MAINISEILSLVEKLITIEEKIGYEIKKESNARKRKKLYKAIKKAHKTGSLDIVRKLLFKL